MIFFVWRGCVILCLERLRDYDFVLVDRLRDYDYVLVDRLREFIC